MENCKKAKYRVEQRTIDPEGQPCKPVGALGRMLVWFHIDSDNNLSYDKAVERIEQLSQKQRWNKFFDSGTGRYPWQYRIVNIKTSEVLMGGDINYCPKCKKWVKFSVRNNISFGVVYVCEYCFSKYKNIEGVLEKMFSDVPTEDN